MPFTPESDAQARYSAAASEQQPATSLHARCHQQPETAPQQIMMDSFSQTLDIFQPLLDPEMLDLFPNGELPDFSAFDTSSLNLDHFDFEAGS
jgi:hypothetical protein